MSDDRITESHVERALDRLDVAASSGAVCDEPEVAELETALTLLAHELSPEIPEPRIKAEIFAEIERRRAAADRKGAEVVPFRPRTKAGRAGTSAWLGWALAAGLVGCALGLIFLFQRVQAQARLLDDQARAFSASAQVEEDLRRAKKDLELVERRLTMVNTVARRAYPMRVVSHQGFSELENAQEKKTAGIVYVCGHHQQWLLSVSGLAPPAADREYRLWFLTPEGQIDGGVLEVKRQGTVAMEDVKMPVGTRAFALTLEPKGATGLPRGEMVLLGDESVSL